MTGTLRNFYFSISFIVKKNISVKENRFLFLEIRGSREIVVIRPAFAIQRKVQISFWGKRNATIVVKINPANCSHSLGMNEVFSFT